SPPVIADDSVTRSILEGTMTKFPNVQLDYLSFANPAAWRDCAKVPYYKNYLDAFGGTCQTLTDGRSAAGYDAMQIVAEGVREVRRTDPKAPVRAGLLAGSRRSRAGKPPPRAPAAHSFWADPPDPRENANVVPARRTGPNPTTP